MQTRQGWQPYVAVGFVEGDGSNTTFGSRNWPLHVTLLRFDLPEAADAPTIVASVLAGAPLEPLTAGEDAHFGRRGHVTVSLIEHDPHLQSLHERLYARVEQAGGYILNPHHWLLGYRPHVSVQSGRRLQEGDSTRIRYLALIDMRPDGNSRLRRVIGQWQPSTVNGMDGLFSHADVPPVTALGGDLPPVTARLQLPVLPEIAFRGFNDFPHLWWPRAVHSPFEAGSQVEFEGDALVETLDDGEERLWARVEDWEPAAMLQLAWFCAAGGPPTHVSVDFNALPDGTGTEVMVRHSGFSGVPDAEATRGIYAEMWPSALDAYRRFMSSAG